MLLKFGTSCRSRGQKLGSLWAFAVEPAEKLLLRIIVEEPQAEPLVRVKVPFGRIDQADADQVALGVTLEEFKSLAPHGDARSKRPSPSRRKRGDEPVERVLTGSTRIHCTDGEIGTLSAITVDSRSGDLEDLSLPFGMAVTRELVIGAEHVDEIRDDFVSLKIRRDDLEGFPTRR